VTGFRVGEREVDRCGREVDDDGRSSDGFCGSCRVGEDMVYMYV
jgi:hypothetical protein